MNFSRLFALSVVLQGFALPGFSYWVYVLSVVLVGLTLPIFSYLTLIYRELGRMTTGRVHEHLDIFEAEIEPKLKINRRSGGRTFRIIGHFWLAFLVLETTRGVVYFAQGTWESFVEFCVFVILEVVFAMHFIPDMLLYRTTGRWLLPLLPLIRGATWLVWPVRVFLEGAESLARISEQEVEKTEEQLTEEGIEALVEAAEEEGLDRAGGGIQRQTGAGSDDAAAGHCGSFRRRCPRGIARQGRGNQVQQNSRLRKIAR